MADIVFVCVREDVARAEALAEAFDAAGFSVETEFTDDALDKCAAAVVVLSAVSARCGAFVEAAHWAIDAGKAVVASLVQTPQTGSEPSQIFDLSAWDGDARSLVLEPLICAIDGLLIAARSPMREILIETEEAGAAPQRWADAPPLRLEVMPPRAAPKIPRAYLPMSPERPRFRFTPRMTVGAIASAMMMVSVAFGAGFLARTPAPRASAQTVVLDEPSAPIVPFEAAIASGVTAETTVYRPEPTRTVAVSPSRAEPPSAARVLRDLQRVHAHAPRRFLRRVLRTPTFIDGDETPA